jgi:hypothetical protein
MRLSLSFAFDDGRIVEIDDLRDLSVQDYVFMGKLHAEKALVIGKHTGKSTAYELALISDVRIAVHTD